MLAILGLTREATLLTCVVVAILALVVLVYVAFADFSVLRGS